MIVALVLAAACSGDCRAQTLFMAMERTLLAKAPLQLEVKSHAEGAVKADATSELSVGPATRLHAQGTFAGKPFEKSFDEPTTPALRDAFVVGLARMGLLHNVVRLSRDQPPDHADGTVREWLQAVSFRRVKGGVSYALQVGGRQSGESTLSINAQTRLPSKRTLVVHFPEGDMRVIETYRFPAKR